MKLLSNSHVLCPAGSSLKGPEQKHLCLAARNMWCDHHPHEVVRKSITQVFGDA